MTATLKKHPIALSIYAAFMLAWLALGYVAYVDFSSFGDGSAMLKILYKFVIYGFLPYVVITFLIYEFIGVNAKSRSFYSLLMKMIIGSISVIIIAGTVFSYFM